MESGSPACRHRGCAAEVFDEVKEAFRLVALHAGLFVGWDRIGAVGFERDDGFLSCVVQPHVFGELTGNRTMRGVLKRRYPKQPKESSRHSLAAVTGNTDNMAAASCKSLLRRWL